MIDKRRRAERLIASLRWFAIFTGLAACVEDLPREHLLAVFGIVVIYNGILTWCTGNSARFARFGYKLALLARVLDTAIITAIVGLTGLYGPPSFILYWFVLVGYAYTVSNLRKLTVATMIVLIANAAATHFVFDKTGNISNVANIISIRSGIIVFGFLISVYTAKSSSQDDLASERGSYLHAILDCGARLTSYRNVHELSRYMLDMVVTETKAVGGQLLLVNDETHELEFEASYETTSESDDQSSDWQDMVQGYANWVFSSGKEFLVRVQGAADENAEITKDNRPVVAMPLFWQSSSSATNSSVLGVLIVWGAAGEDFKEDSVNILRIFTAMSSGAIVNLRLYTNLQKSFVCTLQSLANGLEARDEYTRGHSERVMEVSRLIGEDLGVAEDGMDILRNASLLHDIGKIGVPDDILRKAGKLTADEWESMRRHPLVSEEICLPLGLSPDVLFLVKHHHERLDGKGYPDALQPQEQPLLQRILVVADSFDAMRSRRPYRDILPRDVLRAELTKAAGRTMDPSVIDSLLGLLDSGELDRIYEEHDRMTSAPVPGITSAYEEAA